MQATITKSPHYGYECRSQVVLQEGVSTMGCVSGETGTRVLNFTTYKLESGVIGTYASVAIEVRKNGYTSSSTEIFKDYHKRYNLTACKVATEKAVKQAHAVALETAQEHIAAALAQYGVTTEATQVAA